MHMLNRTIIAAALFLGAGLAQATGFTPCADAASDPALAGSLCAREEVPGDPSGLSGAPARPMSLFVRQFPTQGTSRGQVWLVAGGPGESGAAFYGMLPILRRAFPGFDLVMPDHRGTGFSTRMCPVEEAPDSPGGTALDGAEWGSCFAHLNAHPAYTRQFSQTNAAHDLKLLLERTPHQGKTFVYGVSYGTQLVLRTMAMGAKVDGVVLDSLVPLQDDASADLSRHSLVADEVGRKLLAGCDRGRCGHRIGEPIEPLYRRLLARAEAEPALLANVPGKNLKRFFGSLFDFPKLAARIPDIIKELDAGQDAQLKATLADFQREYESMGSFPQRPPSMPLVILISGSENDLQPRRTMEEVKQEEAGLLFASSIPGHLVGKPIPLYERDEWFARLPARLPPTLVLHGDRDAKTHYGSAVRHIEALRKAGPVQLFTNELGGHFVLWADDKCTTDEVMQFVLGDEVKTRCVVITYSH
ncbi:alpha/beta fold hydrolase [Telluria beijingensis]|uniref:alpha/beta fold hydrolase n=1 Tax=Telluria beijingensis TaxID=3068633 RepID=UPI00279555DA|nr:alpha/beta fold hydrolase [Massilia sp. REN29]